MEDNAEVVVVVVVVVAAMVVVQDKERIAQASPNSAV